MLTTSLKILSVTAVAASLGSVALSAHAQTLLHRYSMNGSAKDSAGKADGTVVGKVTFTTTPGVNGVATFPGGNSSGIPRRPSYISLPASVTRNLQDATIEIYVTRFSGGQPSLNGSDGYYQPLLSVSTPYTDGKTQPNYAMLMANRDPANFFGSGLGMASRVNGTQEMILGSGFDLPKAGGLVTLVFQGFHKVGDVGTMTIYLNGELAVRAGTFFTFKDVAELNSPSGTAVLEAVCIGGGSSYPDPTFNGDITEVRVWSGALSAAQVLADYKAGPATVTALSPVPSAAN